MIPRLAWGLCLILFVGPPRTSSADMQVHFLDVGQGGAVFVEKDGKAILYDCGDTFAGPSVVQYLTALAVTQLDLLVVSHAHRDHLGGCVEVLNRLPVVRVYHNGSSAKTAIWRRFLAAAKEKAAEVLIVHRDREEDGLQFLVAYDSWGRLDPNEANNSILLRVVDGTIRVLLTGDCEARCEREVGGTAPVSADVLNVGHHGSNASSTPAFLTQVAPKIAVISAGAGNPYGHPTPPVLARLKARGIPIYRTDWHGTVVVHSDGKRFTVETDK